MVTSGITSPAASLLGDAFQDSVAPAPQMVEQLVPGLQLVDESVSAPKIVRASRIQEPMDVHALVIPALEVVEEPHETLFSQRAKLFRIRDGEWQERRLGDAKFTCTRKQTWRVSRCKRRALWTISPISTCSTSPSSAS